MERLPPLHALSAFEAAARHLSFLKASEELCVTQSAISHRIRLLEEYLGLRLFLRINRQVALTPQGEVYLKAVRAAIALLDEATQGLRRGARHSLRISVAPGLGVKWLVGRLAEFSQRQPNVDLNLSASTQLANILSGEVDVGIRYGRGSWPGLRAIKLFDEAVFPVCSPAYLARVGTLEVPADLARATLLRNPRLPWRPWFEAAGLDWDEPAAGPYFDDGLMLLEAAVAGQGVALMVGTLGRAYLADGSLLRPFALEHRDRSYYAVITPDAERKPWVMAFVDWLQEAARG